MDSRAYLHKDYLSVWAAGNDRDDGNFSGYNHRHLDGTTNNYTDGHAADSDYIGGHRTLTSKSTAKNIIAVGSILDLPNGWQSAATVTNSPFSSWGPTRDGRLKPEVVTNGQDVYSSSTDANGNDTYSTNSGTSSATASVTGSISLLRERFAEVGGAGS
jgi:subtilisin family serine protease